MSLVVYPRPKGILRVRRHTCSTRETMPCPMVDAAFQVVTWPPKIRGGGVVVESLGALVCNMSETVPLCSTLCVHHVNIVVYCTLKYRLDCMLKNFSTKGWLCWNMKGKVEPGHFARPDLCRCSLHSCWSQEVDPAYVSSFPQTQAASSGAPGSLGRSLRVGKSVELGSQGIPDAALSMTKLLTRPSLRVAPERLSAIPVVVLKLVNVESVLTGCTI